METKLKGALICRAKTVAHLSSPNTARRAVFGYFFKKIVMGVKKEGDAGDETVNIETGPHAPVDIFEAIAQREGEFLQGSSACLAYVIPAYGHRIVARHIIGAELESVSHQLHGRPDGIDPLFLSNVFFQEVVLQRAGNLFPI